MNIWRLMRVCLLACAFALPITQTQAQVRIPSEEAVKAAYLFKLRNYVEWPSKAIATTDGQTIIGVLGAEEVAEHLTKISASRDQEKSSVGVRKLRIGDPISGVNILFVGDSAWKRAAQIVAQARSQSTLVVSDAEDALAGGSVINFRLVEERVRFDISLDAADKSNLKLSSLLLSLALTVIRETQK